MASPNCFASTTAASQGGFSSDVSREKLKIKIYLVNLAKASKHRCDVLFCLYDAFIERSCEQLKIAKRQQMNVEIAAEI